MKTSPLYFLALLLLINSCKRRYHEPELTAEPYLGNELRIEDGYFFGGVPKENGLYDMFFFYRNGVFLFLSHRFDGRFSTLDAFIDNVRENFERYDYADNIYRWGVFKVSGDKITLERWAPPGGGKIPTIVFEGRIVDRENMKIERVKEDGKWKDYKMDLEFSQYLPKPDSVNNFLP